MIREGVIDMRKIRIKNVKPKAKLSTLVDETLEVAPKIIEFLKEQDRLENEEFDKFEREVEENIREAEKQFKKTKQ